ncbi:MAG: hypothetical protein RID81_07145 [Sandaracinaceae bacterium]
MLPDALETSTNMIAAMARETRTFQDRSGTLRESIQPAPIAGSWRAGDLHQEVAAGQPYGIFLEEGTVSHRVEPRHRKALRWAVEGGYGFSRGHVVSGIAPKRFLADALDAHTETMGRVFEQAVGLAAQRAGF